MTQGSIVVTGNCQTGVLAAALRLLMPEREVHAFHAWDITSVAGRMAAQEQLDDAHTWVRMSILEDAGLVAREGTEVVRSPTLTFPAFHPDLVYATTASGSIFRGTTDYHSAIALWAWRRGVAPEDVGRLFRDDVQSALTYDRYWAPSVANMKREFDASDLAFGDFWARAKRSGVFMHSVNHPDASTVATLARAVGTRLGLPQSIWDDPIERCLDDSLAHIQWPVYPFVASNLGVPGSYRWRNGGQVFGDIESWATATWEAYGAADPGDIRSDRLDGPVYDSVLEPHLTKSGAR